MSDTELEVKLEVAERNALRACRNMFVIAERERRLSDRISQHKAKYAAEQAQAAQFEAQVNAARMRAESETR